MDEAELGRRIVVRIAGVGEARVVQEWDKRRVEWVGEGEAVLVDDGVWRGVCSVCGQSRSECVRQWRSGGGRA